MLGLHVPQVLPLTSVVSRPQRSELHGGHESGFLGSPKGEMMENPPTQWMGLNSGKQEVKGAGQIHFSSFCLWTTRGFFLQPFWRGPCPMQFCRLSYLTCFFLAHANTVGTKARCHGFLTLLCFFICPTSLSNLPSLLWDYISQTKCQHFSDYLRGPGLRQRPHSPLPGSGTGLLHLSGHVLAPHLAVPGTHHSLLQLFVGPLIAP